MCVCVCVCVCVGEHWLGLRKAFHIVNQKDARFQLHIALVSYDETTSYASYDDFRLDNETQFYSIHLGRYAGSAGTHTHTHTHTLTHLPTHK